MSDVLAVWQRLKAWFQDYAPELLPRLNPGATQAQLAELEQRLGRPLPEDFRASYALHNGQQDESSTGIIIGLELLPLDSILERMAELERLATEMPDWIQGIATKPEGAIQPFRACRGWVPVTQDSGGNYLGLDLAPGPRGQAGQVIVFGSRENTNYVVAPSWTAFLEHVLFLLESGNVDLKERDADGFREFDTWNPGASHFHDYVARLYKQPGAAPDAIPPPGDVTDMLLPPRGRAYPPGREEEIRQWATGLQHFRFYSSCGGPDEGFGFLISLRCATEQELAEVQRSLSVSLEALGIELDEGARFESTDGVLSLILSGAEGDSVHVTEADYKNARRLEPVLQPHLSRLIHPPRATVDCVCPEYYAGFWGLTARPRFPPRGA